MTLCDTCGQNKRHYLAQEKPIVHTHIPGYFVYKLPIPSDEKRFDIRNLCKVNVDNYSSQL